jgi:hypothetical protein
VVPLAESPPGNRVLSRAMLGTEFANSLTEFGGGPQAPDENAALADSWMAAL